jgi:hypothetical protein
VLQKDGEQVLQLGKVEREKQNARAQSKGICYGILFADQDAIEYVIGFRIDSRVCDRV